MQRLRLSVVVAAVVLAAAFASRTVPATADQNAAIWIDPPDQGVSSTFTVRVMQHSDVATAGTQASISFDRTLLQVVAVQRGAAYTGASLMMGIAPQTGQAAIDEANQASGRLWQIAAYFSPGAGAAPAGDAEFLVITLAPVAGATGGSEIRPTRTEMYDVDANELLDVALASGRVAVGDADGDGISGPADNCPFDANPDQANLDRNFIDLHVFGQTFDDLTAANSDQAGDVCDPDRENDGLGNGDEPNLGPGGPAHALCPSASAPTDPLNADTDGDRALDRAECALGTDPANAASKPPTSPAGDTDHDSLTDAFEAAIGSDPAKVDTDGDFINDGIEYKAYNTNPLAVNTDGDACGDGREVGSLNEDLTVDQADALIVAQSFGYAPGPPYVLDFDLNKDGVINSTDQLTQSRVSGPCP